MIAQYKEKKGQISLSKMELFSELAILKKKNVAYKKNVKMVNDKMEEFEELNEKIIIKERKE